MHLAGDVHGLTVFPMSELVSCTRPISYSDILGLEGLVLPMTASTSSGLDCSIKVSKMTCFDIHQASSECVLPTKLALRTYNVLGPGQPVKVPDVTDTKISLNSSSENDNDHVKNPKTHALECPLLLLPSIT